MIGWLKNNMPIVYSWAALIAVAALVYFASRDTQFAQFGIGLVAAAIALLVLVAVFEAIWQAIVARFESSNDKAAPGTPKHRQRGQ